MTDLPFLSIDSASRRVSLDVRDPGFYTDPNRTYAALHACSPTFYWEEQRQWYFTGYDHVNALLRDRRFGRQILHIATREELGMPEPAEHTRHFDKAEEHSLLEIEPPEHTRLRTLVNRVDPALLLYFVTRNASSTRAKAGEGCLRLG